MILSISTEFQYVILKMERVEYRHNVYPFSVIVGEFANFAAYAFASATLVAPLGALSVLLR